MIAKMFPSMILHDCPSAVQLPPGSLKNIHYLHTCQLVTFRELTILAELTREELKRKAAERNACTFQRLYRN